MINRIFSYLKKSLTKADLILITFFILCTLASFSLWIKREVGQKVIIAVDGKPVKTFPLNDDTKQIQIVGQKGPFVIEIKNRKVRMKDSTCPSKLCVKMGWISHEGQMIICIPNRVTLKVAGQKETYDALAR
jgi:hypothetical protein